MMTGRVSAISRIGEDSWLTPGPGSPPERHSGTGARLILRVTIITLVSPRASVCSPPRPRGQAWRPGPCVRAWGAAWSPHTRAGQGAPGETSGTGSTPGGRGLVSAGPADPPTGHRASPASPAPASWHSVVRGITGCSPRPPWPPRPSLILTLTTRKILEG